MSAPVNERSLIARLVAGMPRSRHQANRLHESDAELLRLPGTTMTLAVTTDGVVEEIASGLYGDPYLAGWMSIVVNASDLAAVGAAPLGVLVSESLPADMPDGDVARLQAGIAAAARMHDLPVLGGDTNTSPSLQITGTAVGIVGEGPLLTRRGAAPGDRIFASGPLGWGAAFAHDRLMAESSDGSGVAFRPIARLREGQLVARWASACMDTSDGGIPTVDELMRINDVGVRMDVSWQVVLHPAALHTVQRTGLPSWMLLAGPHGEFELLFTVPRERCEPFLTAAAATGWHPIEMGEVVAEGGFACRMDESWLTLDTTAVRNLFGQVGGDPRRYVAALRQAATLEAATGVHR